MNQTDIDAVMSLHHGFMKANTHEDVAFLRENTIGGGLTWFNLNKSNYIGTDAIVDLWNFLRDARPDTKTDAPLTTRGEEIVVNGDVAWLTYYFDVNYDFGEVAQFHGAARATEIWTREESGWKLNHFHCSEHQPGNMGGI